MDIETARGIASNPEDYDGFDTARARVFIEGYHEGYLSGLKEGQKIFQQAMEEIKKPLEISGGAMKEVIEYNLNTPERV